MSPVTPGLATLAAAIAGAFKSKYYYPGIDASPEVLRRLQQENA